MAQNDEQLQFAQAPKLFGKWSYDEAQFKNNCFEDYISISSSKSQVYLPHTAGRYQVKRFRKALCPIVERLVGSMQYHGRNTGKKAKAIIIVKQAFDIIHLLTGENPLKVLVEALINGGAREDSTKIGTGGVARRQAVDVSPLRRVNTSIYFMTKGCRDKSFKNIRSIAECLAEEIINTKKNNPQSSAAIRKRDEIEKVAKTNR